LKACLRSLRQRQVSPMDGVKSSAKESNIHSVE
jgi:hypothetical protein